MNASNFTEKTYYVTTKSFLGEVGIIWVKRNKQAKIIRIFLPRRNMKMKSKIKKVFPGAIPNDSAMILKIRRKIEKFLRGNQVDFSLACIDLSRFYNFQKKILLIERKIPYGWISTYGRLAMKAGHPMAARAAGTALARNPYPIIIPCHRTIRTDGSLGGFGGGIKLKRELLQMEGVKFNRKGNVVMEKVW
jgi:methylated-DNA-[protein]-cysteine S-methyltransferase